MTEWALLRRRLIAALLRILLLLPPGRGTQGVCDEDEATIEIHEEAQPVQPWEKRELNQLL